MFSLIASDSNLGATIGAESVTLTAAQNGKHDHQVGNSATTIPGTSWVNTGSGSTQLYWANASNKTAMAGSGESHENRPPSLYLNYLVKV